MAMLRTQKNNQKVIERETLKRCAGARKRFASGRELQQRLNDSHGATCPFVLRSKTLRSPHANVNYFRHSTMPALFPEALT